MSNYFKGRELLVNMAHEVQEKKTYCIKIDAQACKECGYCIAVCPTGVFSQGSHFNTKGYRPAQAENAAKCIGCRRCFFACPDFAIDILEKVVKD